MRLASLYVFVCHVRGGAGISKVDHSCMCRGGGGSTTGNVRHSLVFRARRGRGYVRQYLWNQNAWVSMQSGLGSRSAGKRVGTITRNAYMQGVWDTWPNRLVLRLSLQSENETNDSLKSGPALAGPAGPATPPLHVRQWHTRVKQLQSLHWCIQHLYFCDVCETITFVTWCSNRGRAGPSE